MEPHSKSYKVLLVGDGGVGKTSYVRRMGTGRYTSKYNSTIGVEIHPLEIPTVNGDVILDMWDTAGQEKLGPLRDKYYYNADFAIIMFDLCSRISYKNVARWHNDITRVCNGGIPTLIIGNKVDITDRKVHSRNITYHQGREDFMTYFEISVKQNININEPIKWILERVQSKEVKQVPEQLFHEEIAHLRPPAGAQTSQRPISNFSPFEQEFPPEIQGQIQRNEILTSPNQEQGMSNRAPAAQKSPEQNYNPFGAITRLTYEKEKSKENELYNSNPF